MQLKANIHAAEEGGFRAEVPAVPGCATQGETLCELLANVNEAATGYFKTLNFKTLEQS